jgi:hypothetical protein
LHLWHSPIPADRRCVGAFCGAAIEIDSHYQAIQWLA